jgi:hypothetical protein
MMRRQTRVLLQTFRGKLCVPAQTQGKRLIRRYRPKKKKPRQVEQEESSAPDESSDSDDQFDDEDSAEELEEKLELFEPEKIMGHTWVRKDVWSYRVRWRNCGHDEDTEEMASAFKEAQDIYLSYRTDPANTFENPKPKPRNKPNTGPRASKRRKT